CGTVAVTKCQWGSSPQFTTKEDRTQCRRVLCPLHEQQRPWGLYGMPMSFCEHHAQLGQMMVNNKTCIIL
ncbi:unnamed protein product, partial [Didymodactylos carnosus]